MKKLMVILMLMVVSITSFAIDEGLEVGDKLISFKVYGTDGKGVTPDTFKGKTTIYNIGASWCPPCKKEKPQLNKFYLKNKGKVNVVSIMIDREEDVEAFYREVKVDFPHFIDKDQEASRRLLIKVVPTTYIVDKDGIIMARLNGAIDWEKVDLKDIEELKGGN